MRRFLIPLVAGFALTAQAQTPTGSELASQVGHIQIAVLPAAPRDVSPAEVLETNELARQGVGTLESWLTARTYEVAHMPAKEQLETAVDAIAGLSGLADDPCRKVALALGTDVLITFEGAAESVVGGRRIQVILKAFETTTGRLLGTETEFSAPSVNVEDKKLVDEILPKVQERLMEKVDAYWKQDLARGIQYVVQMRLDPGLGEDLRDDVTDALDDLLGASFPERKEVTSTQQSAEYVVWAPGDKYKSSTSVSKVFRKKLELPSVKVNEVHKNRKILLLSVKRR
jgi:hypothetical protein